MKPAGPYTTVPNDFIDRVMADCNGGAVKVFLYLCRRIEGTIRGRRRGCDAVAVSQICNGIRKASGEVLDRGTGLGKAAVIKALTDLESLGVITRKRGAGTTADTYELTTVAPAQRCENQTASGTKIEPVAAAQRYENRTARGTKIEPLSGLLFEPTKESKKESQKESTVATVLRKPRGAAAAAKNGALAVRSSGDPYFFESNGKLPLRSTANACVEEFPETSRAIHKYFPDADSVFVTQIVTGAAQALAGVEQPKVQFSDGLVAKAIESTHKTKQRGAGLWLLTIPACIRTWAIEGEYDREAENERRRQERIAMGLY